ncbi:hypothetical protein ACFFNY_11310 [Paenibacillus hodogayensis]|uniref:Uncharacterized protein n=1 Tax=Paenibacillus hodogayensis TaxID=279208 RepID=A0ABV5VV78_9BACL
MGRYKLLAIDMDGTLLNEESLISDDNCIWIHKALEGSFPHPVDRTRGARSISVYG